MFHLSSDDSTWLEAWRPEPLSKLPPHGLVLAEFMPLYVSFLICVVGTMTPSPPQLSGHLDL